MQGYVIVLMDEETGEIESYWADGKFDQDISKAQFIQDKSAARSAAGRLQAARPDAEYKAVSAELTISLTSSFQPQPLAV